MTDRLSMFNLIYLSYNKAMSMDNSGQTLEQLKKHIPDYVLSEHFKTLAKYPIRTTNI